MTFHQANNPNFNVLGSLCLALSWFFCTAPAADAAPRSAAYQTLGAQIKQLYKAGRHKDIVPLIPKRLELFDAEIGLETEQGAVELGWMTKLYLDQKLYAKAAPLARRLIKVREKVWGADIQGTILARRMLADAYTGMGRLDEAENIYRQVLAAQPKSLRNSGSFIAKFQGDIARVKLKQGQHQAALAQFRVATSNHTREFLDPDKNTFRTATAEQVMERGLKDAVETFAGLTSAAWHVNAETGRTNETAFAEESFAASQWAWRSAAAKAISQMAARLGAGKSAIARRVAAVQQIEKDTKAVEDETWKLMGDWSKKLRTNPDYEKLTRDSQKASYASSRKSKAQRAETERLVPQIQDLAKRIGTAGSDAERKKLQAELARLTSRLRAASQSMSKNRQPVLDAIKRMGEIEKQTPGYAAYHSRTEALKKEMVSLGFSLRKAREALRKEFPAYRDLANPKPVTLAEIRVLLKPREALVSFLFGEEESFGWMVTRTGATWKRLDMTRDRLTETVRDLRKGLSPVEGELFRQSGGLAFDLKLAHSLYNSVLAPFKPALEDIDHIMVVPSGALQSLPLAVLVTTPPSKQYETYYGYRKTPWLIRKFALTTLPSVPSLKALRLFAKSGSPDRAPFIGFGDPVLTGPKGPSRSAPAKLASRGVRSGYVPRGLARVASTSDVSVDVIRQLYPLPDTADELRQIARTLNADASVLHLRDQASEKRLRAQHLERYQVISFATHGLISDELPGLTEPALVLTPPAKAGEEDDGLLLSSEIAQLELDADWVLLSACNTASGGKAGAEGLSGLARAFFFAGARALLVSHWPVYSDAAVSLTTRIFDVQNQDKAVSRAEALRRSIIALIDDTSRVDNGHPSRWAPFVLVGDGAAN